jgi:hypothetical protein
MTDRFVVVDRPVAHLNGSWRLAHGTTLPTPGTRLVVAQASELVLEDVLDDALDDGLTDVDGRRRDGVEVQVEPRSFFAVSAPGDDLPPPVSHVTEIGHIVGLTLGERHGVFVLELGE